MPGRRVISDLVRSWLIEETGYTCPLCGQLESTSKRFTDHHINHDPSVSEYWNLLRICRPCHDKVEEHAQDSSWERKLWQVKRGQFRRYFGPEAYKAMVLADEDTQGLVTATPITALEILRRGYLKMHRENILTVGPATNVSTFDTYQITAKGREIVERLGLRVLPRTAESR